MKFLRKKKSKRYLLPILAVCLVVVVGVLGHVEQTQAVAEILRDAFRDLKNDVLRGLTLFILKVLDKFINFLGGLMAVFVEFIRDVASYEGYRTQDQVIEGWKIVRDIINSFYIVVLITIAIATIIRWKLFDFRTTLPKLLISAVIVNFSRTICLLAIAFADSVMRTFLRAVGEAWPAFLLGLRAPATTALSSTTLNLSGSQLDPGSLALGSY